VLRQGTQGELGEVGALAVGVELLRDGGEPRNVGEERGDLLALPSGALRECRIFSVRRLGV
jgi:hypothetical protein